MSLAMKGLTLRSVAVGLGIGALLAAANVYVGLKTSWWDSGGITAAVVAFALLGRSRGCEGTVIAETLASAASSMPAALGVMGAIPAMVMLHLSIPPTLSLCVWGLLMGALGMLMATLLRERVLLRDRLPFPSGVAIANVVTTLHRTGSRKDGARLLLAAVAAATVTYLRDTLRWIPQALQPKLAIGEVPASAAQLGVSVSPLLLALGAMVGLGNGLMLGLGSVSAWVVLAPLLVHYGLVTEPKFDALLSWLLWPGAALMVASGVVTLAQEWRAVASALRDLRTLNSRRSAGVGALAGFALLVTYLGQPMFGLSWPVGILLLAACTLASTVAIRVSGEVAFNPIAQIGEVTQLALAAGAPGGMPANLGGGAIVSGSVVQAGVLSESFKVGELTGVAAREQILASAIGVLAGTLVTLPVFWVLVRAHGLGSPLLPAPAAAPWMALAQVADRGLAALPPGAVAASAVALGVGAALELARRSSKGRHLPSPLMMGIGFVLPLAASSALVLGAFLGWLARRRKVSGVEPLVGGLVAGESVAGLAIAIQAAGAGG
jgi:uncharacterized oligopeptide transporter (OPT) family protein